MEGRLPEELCKREAENDKESCRNGLYAGAYNKADFDVAMTGSETVLSVRIVQDDGHCIP